MRVVNVLVSYRKSAPGLTDQVTRAVDDCADAKSGPTHREDPPPKSDCLDSRLGRPYMDAAARHLTRISRTRDERCLIWHLLRGSTGGSTPRAFSPFPARMSATSIALQSL